MSIKDRLIRNDWLGFNEYRRDRWVRQVVSGLPAGSKVLDVGAGSAPYRDALSHCDYRTQDFAALSPEQLRGGAYAQVDYVCDASSIPVPDTSFDVVICTEMLEHVPEPILVVKELGRILKPGGQLILTAPLGSGIHQDPYHYYGGYTPYWYKKFLCEAGFEKIVVEANAGFFKYFSQESIRFVQLSSPCRIPRLPGLLWTPFWLLMLPLMAGVIPLFSMLLDRYDRARNFTVGYFVTAIKSARPSNV